jgi:hypothetical protein
VTFQVDSFVPNLRASSQPSLPIPREAGERKFLRLTHGNMRH